MRSVVSIVREMEDFYAAYGVNRFNFVDDNFLNSEKQVWDFYAALKKSDIDFKWRFQGRADTFSAKLAEALLDVGLYDVSFGIESGSVEILSEMNKREGIHKAAENIKALPAELLTHGTFIVGMPGETQATIEQTTNFIKDSGLTYANAGILTVFPATALYDMAKARGLISNDDEYCDNLGPVYVRPYINLTSYSDEQLLAWARAIDAAGRDENNTSVTNLN